MQNPIKLMKFFKTLRKLWFKILSCDIISKSSLISFFPFSHFFSCMFFDYHFLFPVFSIIYRMHSLHAQFSSLSKSFLHIWTFVENFLVHFFPMRMLSRQQKTQKCVKFINKQCFRIICVISHALHEQEIFFYDTLAKMGRNLFWKLNFKNFRLNSPFKLCLKIINIFRWLWISLTSFCNYFA